MSHPRFPAKPVSIFLLGFGAFGQLIARELSAHARIVVCDPAPQAQEAARRAGLPLADLAEAGAQDLVLLAGPTASLAEQIASIAPHLHPGQIVIDTCSVKSGPAGLMRDLLPGGVEILGTHPMFGPSSLGRDGLAGRQIVLCPIRGGAWRRIGAFLRHQLRLRVTVSTPEEHDRQAAFTQGLTHLIARAMAELGPAPKIRTRSFELMMEGLDLVRDDAPEVFRTITTANPFVAPLQARLAAALAGGKIGDGPAVAG